MSGLGARLIANGDAYAVVAFCGLLLAWACCSLRLRSGIGIRLRQIGLYRRLPQMAERATEAGIPVALYLSAGCQDLAGPETVASLSLYTYMSRQAARSDLAAPACLGNPVTLLLSLAALERSRQDPELKHLSAPGEILYWGSDPLAYATGAALAGRMVGQQARLLSGSGGPELLFASHAALAEGSTHPGPLGNPSGSALLSLTQNAEPRHGDAGITDVLEPPVESLPGEDLFAGEAYLHRPEAAASLLSEDYARWALVAIILIAVVLSSL